MGSENSKSDDERVSQRNKTKNGVSDRLYTEDEINRALANQRRMFEAKQSKMQTSSRIYPDLQTQNLNTINTPSTSNTAHYILTPSAPALNDLPSPGNTHVSRQTYQQANSVLLRLKRPSHATPTTAGTSYATPTTAGPSHATPTSAGPSYASPTSAGPSYASPTSAGPLHATPTTAGTLYALPTSSGPSHATPTTAGPSYASPTSAGPSYASPTSAGPSHATPTTAGTLYALPTSSGPLHATPTTAGPSYAKPTSDGPHKRNQKQYKDHRTRSRSRVNQNKRESSGIVNCVTCNGKLSHHIYQCTNGHSSCDGCRFKMARCGNCSQLITDMRNITLESTLVDMTINTEEQVNCPNAKDGCGLYFKTAELQHHLKECPFNIISCPIMEFSGDCTWKGMIKQLATHFSEAHPRHCEADVNKEMHMIVMTTDDYKVMHLVNIGSYKFLVHIQLKNCLNNIFMVTQYLGTNFSAAKWTYEWHLYNKKQPRRKFEYKDICKSHMTPVSEIINNNDCAAINVNYANTFVDSGKVTFKFYIKKRFNNKNNIDKTSN